MCTSDSTGRDSTLGLDFEVVVFAGGPRGNVAWQVLRTQNSVAFEYPLQSEVGAFYEQSAQKVTAGPFPAELGSTWEAFRKNERTALLVSEDHKAKRNPHDAIEVNYLPSSEWTATPINIGVYKGGKVFLLQKNVSVGNKADFVLQSKLSFGTTLSDPKTGEQFSVAIFSEKIEVDDLSKHPNGVLVEVAVDSASGEFVFTVSDLQ